MVITVLEKKGSGPRGIGARMVVAEQGLLEGTVGGGTLEQQAVCCGIEGIRKKRSFIREYSLNDLQAGKEGMICGGKMTLYFQYISADDEETKRQFALLFQALEEDEKSWLSLDITDPSFWKMKILKEGINAEGLPEELRDRLKENAGWIKTDRGEWYVEPLARNGKVYIFGGGHVARALTPVLALAGFSCIVMDDREEFASDERFPEAEQVITGDFLHISRYVSIRPWDYVCIMTRGHQYDYYVQRQVLALKPYYIGVMGSKNKIKAVTEKLLNDGFSIEDIESCHMPIGLKIQAETPEEIAVSIAGELIFFRSLQKKGKVI